jgi:hypothetical protein
MTVQLTFDRGICQQWGPHRDSSDYICELLGEAYVYNTWVECEFGRTSGDPIQLAELERLVKEKHFQVYSQDVAAYEAAIAADIKPATLVLRLYPLHLDFLNGRDLHGLRYELRRMTLQHP